MLVNNSCLAKSSTYTPKISHSQKPLTFKSQDAFEKTAQKPEENNKNPVNKVGEFFLSLSKTFYRSLGTGSRAMLGTLMTNPGSTDDIAGEILLSGVVGALVFAGTYIVTLPVNIYKSTINFVKDKETMDVFLGSHEIKRDIYNKEKEEIKNGALSTSEASSQLMKMKTANINCPEFAQGTLAGQWFVEGFFLGSLRSKKN